VHMSEHLNLAVLIPLAIAKLACLIAIYRNTTNGNEERWNDKAIDYRYLSERLRTANYLPLVADLHPPQSKSAQYMGGALRQNVMDWLFQAIIRQAPPSTGLLKTDPPALPWTKEPPGFYRPDLLTAATRVTLRWLGTQIAYHKRVGDTQDEIYHWIHSLMQRSNTAVILIVALDLLILFILAGALAIDAESEFLQTLHKYSPLLIFIAVVLPAVVAGLNGLNFQSECKRISLRSNMTLAILTKRQAEWEDFAKQLATSPDDPADPGAWILKSIDMVEACAQIMTDEVAEWSVLYSRELSDI